MKARIEVGTDIAMLGAWDSGCDSQPLTKTSGREFDEALKADARAGHLFILRTGADCGGQLEVLIDEDIRAEWQHQMKRQPGEFLLSVPSGRMIVGGVEDYRMVKRRITGPDSVVAVAPGHYLLNCYVGPEESESSLPSKADMARLIGAEDYQYYQRVERQGLFGFLLVLLFPAFIPFVGWKLSAVLTIAALLVYFNLFERVRLKRDQRYQRINKLVNDAYRTASASDFPLFVFHLHKIPDATGLTGGSIKLN